MKQLLYNTIDIDISNDDRKLLFQLLNIAKQKNNYTDSNQSYNINSDEVFFQTFIKNFDTDYKHTPFFKKLELLFSNIPNFDYYKKTQIVKITGSLVPHIDARSCVFTIPLENTVHPITWYNDDDTVMYQHYYSTPVLINTHIRHGCLENTNDRYLFQVGIDNQFGDFSKINTLISGALS